MQENTSVIDSYSTGNAVQIMLEKLLRIYDAKTLVTQLNSVGENYWSAAILKRASTSDPARHRLSEKESAHLRMLLPKPPEHHPYHAFRLIDLPVGIDGIRRGFESVGGQCVFINEWNKHAARTYKANYYYDPAAHHPNEDIRDITLSHQGGVSDEMVAEHTHQHISGHGVLLTGFPCQPFSLADVSRRSSFGRAHGPTCNTQGTLFFDVARIIDARRPAMFVLENVKNPKGHDKGKTSRITMQTLDKLGYDAADAEGDGLDDSKVIDGKHFLPQHRERIALVGFRRDLDLKADFILRDVSECFPVQRVTLTQLLDPVVEVKYILASVLWEYLYRYAEKHQAHGGGFGYGMVYPSSP